MRRTLEQEMRDVVRLEHVLPNWWARTFEAYGWTADMVQAARDAEIERLLRNRPEVAADD